MTAKGDGTSKDDVPRSVVPGSGTAGADAPAAGAPPNGPGVDGPLSDQVEAEVLARITPTTGETAALLATVERLEAAAQARMRELGTPGTAAVQGSVAKGTWLAGDADLDLFLLVDPTVKPGALEELSRKVAAGLLSDVRTKYAQHPYAVGRFEGRQVDLVPAYLVADAASKISAVDRTPFHTKWVRDHLDETARGQVRLAKRWLKGTGAYGAQTAIAGFSGYLVEVLVAHLASFNGVLAWLAGDARPRRIALGSDHVNDDVSPLVIVDPVDPARNCAAGVQAETLERAAAAAQAYLAAPRRAFFFPAPAAPQPRDKLEASLGEARAQWTGLLVEPATDRLDIVLPQFQRAARTVASALADAGFSVVRQRVAPNPSETQLLFQWLTTGGPLPARRVHRGPAADREPNAAKFREKWIGHRDAAGPIRTGADGRLEVDVHVRHRDPPAWLEAALPALELGKHATASLKRSTVFADPADVPDEWRAEVGEFVLGRPPWER